MNYERVLAVLMVICFIASIVLFSMSYPVVAGISLYISAVSLVMLFIRGATTRNKELDELNTVRD